MKVNTNQLQRVNSIHLAQEIEKLFKLDLDTLYMLPKAVQLAIIAKLGHKADLPRIAAYNESEVR
jgi:hypothetical protein